MTYRRGGRSRSSRACLALVVLALVVLAGCTTVRGIIDTERALERAGFDDIDIGFDSNEGFDQIEIAVRPLSTEGDAETLADEAATVVWTTFPLRFDLLRVEVLGPFEEYTTTYTYGEMAEIFGPRPANLDDKELSDDVVRAGVGIAIVLAVGGILFLAAVVLAIVMGVRTSRRRQSITPPPWPPVVGPGPG